MTAWHLTFLGVGNAAAPQLGSASVVLEKDDAPLLMVDCGQEALTACLERYGGPPPAVFVTHVHMDHVAGFERRKVLQSTRERVVDAQAHLESRWRRRRQEPRARCCSEGAG